jgi:hypothetical protein
MSHAAHFGTTANGPSLRLCHEPLDLVLGVESAGISSNYVKRHSTAQSPRITIYPSLHSVPSLLETQQHALPSSAVLAVSHGGRLFFLFPPLLSWVAICCWHWVEAKHIAKLLDPTELLM